MKELKPSVKEIIETADLFQDDDKRKKQLIALLFLDDEWLSEILDNSDLGE